MSIDNDALARRIAIDIMTACRGGPEERAIRLDLINLEGRRLGAWAIDALARRIAEHLREALPTSEDAVGDGLADDTAAVQAGRVIFTKSIDVSKLERAKPILSDRDVEDEQTTKETVIRGIGPDGKPMDFRLAAGRMFENVCPDCGETNGGGIDSEQSREWRLLNKHDPCNIPCMHCGKGPMQVVFLSDEDEQYTRDVLDSASKNQNYKAMNGVEELIDERDRAEDAADLMAALILGEPIDWPCHEDAWRRAILAITSRNEADES